MPLEIFCCYARKDQELLEQLKAHLMPLQRQGLIIIWADTDINAGQQWESEIDRHLDTADIILLLVSPDFMGSDYGYSKELRRAMERHRAGEARVIPIILRPVYWQGAPFAHIQVLPRDGIPVTDARWSSRDEAFHNVTQGIIRVVEEINQRRNPATSPSLKPLNSVSPPLLSPTPKVNTVMKVGLIASVVFLLAAIPGGILLWEGIHHSSPPSPRLYQADFLTGDQGWLRYAHSSQWTYNTHDKALESDGSLYCCSASTISNIIIVAPYTLSIPDYTIEARIKVTGINTSHSYTESDKDQEPFFGLYVQGDASNEAGYMAGINGFPIGEPHTGAYSSFLAYGPTLPQGKIFHGTESGGKNYVLDKTWHTYRLDVKNHAFLLSIDNIQVYSAPIEDNNFSSGPKIGIADYDLYLQVQSFAVSSL